MVTTMESAVRSKVNLIIASFLLALCFLSNYIYLLNSALHGFLNIFAGGRSDIKITLFFVYTAALFLLNIKEKSDKSFLKRIKIGYLFMISWVGFIFAYNLLLLLVFFHKFGFKLRDFVVLFNNNEVSSTKLLHNHVGKGAMGFLLNQLHLAHQENVDTGLAFLHLLPNFDYILGLVFLLISIVIFIIYYREHLSNQKTRQIILTLLYSIVTFSILKNYIDGGIFNRETLVSIAALLLIILPKSKRAFTLIPVIAFTILTAIAYYTKLSPIAEVLYDMGMAIVFMLIVVTLWYWWQFPKANRLGIMLIILTLASLSFPFVGLAAVYNQSGLSITDQIGYVALYNNDPKLGQPIETIGNLKIYQLNGQYNTERDVFKAEDLIDNIQPVTIEWQNCLPVTLRIIKFQVVTFGSVTFTSTGYRFGNIVKFKQTPFKAPNNEYKYDVIAVLDPCTPRPLNVLQELLGNQINQPYFVLNLQDPYAN